MMFGHSHGMEGMMMGSPFFCAGEIAFEACDARGSRPDHFGWAAFWSLAYGFAAVMLLGATLLTFNRCLGRVEGVNLPIRKPKAKVIRPLLEGDFVDGPFEVALARSSEEASSQV
jgi:hypothetical protein